MLIIYLIKNTEKKNCNIQQECVKYTEKKNSLNLLKKCKVSVAIHLF